MVILITFILCYHFANGSIFQTCAMCWQAHWLICPLRENPFKISRGPEDWQRTTFWWKIMYFSRSKSRNYCISMDRAHSDHSAILSSRNSGIPFVREILRRERLGPPVGPRDPIGKVAKDLRTVTSVTSFSLDPVGRCLQKQSLLWMLQKPDR